MKRLDLALILCLLVVTVLQAADRPVGTVKGQKGTIVVTVRESGGKRTAEIKIANTAASLLPADLEKLRNLLIIADGMQAATRPIKLGPVQTVSLEISGTDKGRTLTLMTGSARVTLDTDGKAQLDTLLVKTYQALHAPGQATTPKSTPSTRASTDAAKKKRPRGEGPTPSASPGAP